MIFMSSIPTLASAPNSEFLNSNNEETINPKTNELNLQVFAQMQKVIDEFSFKPDRYIPLQGLPEHANGDRVGARVLQHSVETLMADSSKGSFANTINKTSNFQKSAEKNDYQLNFKLNSTRAKAEFSYAKIVTAVLSYDATSQSGLKIEVTHPISNSQLLAYTHGNGNLGGVEDRVGVRWSF